jgi:Mrp family chromosome partitioning ATPase
LAQLDLDASPVRSNVGSAQGPGLSDVLAGRCPLDQALRAAPVGAGSVDCLGPGSAEPASPAAGSERLDAFVREMRRRYDHILLDVAATPHALEHAPLALAADLRISVVRLGHTRRKAFEAQCLAWRAQESRAAAVILGDYAA